MAGTPERQQCPGLGCHQRRKPTNEKRVVEGVLSADHVRTEAPEESADEHTGVDGDGETIGK